MECGGQTRYSTRHENRGVIHCSLAFERLTQLRLTSRVGLSTLGSLRQVRGGRHLWLKSSARDLVREV